MQKIVIYSTCQGGIVSGLLKNSPDIRSNYDIRYYLNFARPGELKCDIPDEELAETSLLLYHPIVAKDGGFGTDMLLEKLPDGAQAYVLPYVTFAGYWPELGRVPSAPLGVSAENPYGRIPYRSEVLDAMLDDGATPQEAMEAYLAIDPATALKRAEAVIDADIRYLERIDAQDGPFKVKDYILENFRERQLFYIFNHPKTEIYSLMANQLMESLGMPPLDPRILGGFRGHAEQNMPIHPATAAALGLNFVTEDTRYEYLGESFTFREFVARYIEYVMASKEARQAAL